MDLAPLIDHTLLRADATRDDIERLCREAVAHRFFAVCVNPVWVARCRKGLEGSAVRVASVVDFPLGAGVPEAKAFEAGRAVAEGAHELDMVLDIGALRSGELSVVERGIVAVVEAAGPGVPVKVILETAMLSRDEKVAAAKIAVACGARFVKTSTGFAGGATVEDVRLLREVVGSGAGIKASGGIRTPADAMAMVNAGATRIGTSSGVAIVAGAQTASRVS